MTATAGKPGTIPTPLRAAMVLVTSGMFLMGSDRHYSEEAPAHRVSVDLFWIDWTPVPNREFLQFVGAKHVRQRARVILRLRPSFGEGRIPGRTPLPARASSIIKATLSIRASHVRTTASPPSRLPVDLPELYS